MSLADMRRDYGGGPLTPMSVGDDPLAFFRGWLDEAVSFEPELANVMSLATIDEAGRPSVRAVLLKGMEDGALQFFTDYRSPKAQHLERRPDAELLFFWAPLERQVRVSGRAQRLPRELSERYFRTRPRGSQIAASVSVQSAVIASRDDLERRYDELSGRLGDGEVPMPEHWGGFALRPESFEFWQGRANRLHDRVRCRRVGEAWVPEVLAP